MKRPSLQRITRCLSGGPREIALSRPKLGRHAVAWKRPSEKKKAHPSPSHSPADPIQSPSTTRLDGQSAGHDDGAFSSRHPPPPSTSPVVAEHHNLSRLVPREHKTPVPPKCAVQRPKAVGKGHDPPRRPRRRPKEHLGLHVDAAAPAPAEHRPAARVAHAGNDVADRRVAAKWAVAQHNRVTGAAVGKGVARARAPRRRRRRLKGHAERRPVGGQAPLGRHDARAVAAKTIGDGGATELLTRPPGRRGGGEGEPRVLAAGDRDEGGGEGVFGPAVGVAVKGAGAVQPVDLLACGGEGKEGCGVGASEKKAEAQTTTAVEAGEPAAGSHLSEKVFQEWQT